ncbi:YgaP family membrane protein [Sphingomonas jaspsi]|jgi:hypothetical protein|uniref:YgaP family membrane protein n=1 Tax=Sphingomonas jaspsi TaxID=392409 RepID=UPI0004BCEFE0|nr:DUF2892 domain-containing protein [Sphingomonas jaspsi]
MIKNVAAGDRIARLLIAMVIVFVIAMGFIEGPMAWVLGALAIVFFGTAVAGHCPFYKAIGIDSHSHDGTEHYGG